MHARMNTVAKLALLAVFDNTVKPREKLHTTGMPVSPKYISSKSSVNIASEVDFSETINATELNILVNIKSQLEAFETRLLNDYNTQNMLPETDLKFLMLMIDSFSKIFQLWHKNSVLKNSVQSKVFYDIFSVMFRKLNEEPISSKQNGENTDLSINLIGICDICDEQFELIDNDANKSFAEHQRSKIHIEAVYLFNKIGTSDKMVYEDLKETTTNHSCNENTRDIDSQSIAEESKYMKRNVNDTLKENSYFLKQLDKKSDFECYLCDVIVNNENNMLDHCNSKIHRKHKSYFFNKPQLISGKQTKFSDDLIFARGKFFYCILCQCIEKKLYLSEHIKSKHHKGWKDFARKVTKLEQPYLFKINEKSDICFCELCSTTFNMKNSIIPHCLTKNHIKLKHFADEIQIFLK